MTQKSSSERRRYSRILLPKGMRVAWQGGGQRVVSRVRTVSMGGLFICTADPPPVGTILKLIFEVPGGDVRARAAVRHRTPGDGMGVEFKGMDYPDRARLNQLLKRLLR